MCDICIFILDQMHYERAHAQALTRVCATMGTCFEFESVNGHLKVHYHGTKAMNTRVICVLF